MAARASIYLKEEREGRGNSHSFTVENLEKVDDMTWLVLLYIPLVYAIATSNNRGKFFIGGLFPTDAEDPRIRAAFGQYPELAAKLAVRHVRESGLLASHGVSLELLSFQTKCRQDDAVYAYLQMIQAVQMQSRGKFNTYQS